VESRSVWILPTLCAAALAAASSDYFSAKHKLDLIEGENLRSGSRVELTPAELNAYVAQEAHAAFPDSVRDVRISLAGPGLVQGAAIIDFGKLRRAQGDPPGWLMSKLLDGDRPVRVTARVTSAGGRGQVDLQEAQVNGITLDGEALDFLIHTFLLPAYPDAAVGRPFELHHHIERIDVTPSAVGILIGR
jgi:hypothetical protein